jgi:hypothetical protein
MPCEEWLRFVARYRSAVQTYSETIDDWSDSRGAKFNEAWQLAENARKDAVESRAALLEHEHDHGCLTDQVDTAVNVGSRRHKAS